MTSSDLKDIIINEIASCASHKKVYEFQISYASFKDCCIFIEEKTILLTEDLFQEINSDTDQDICRIEFESYINKQSYHVNIEKLGLSDTKFTDIDCFQTTNGGEHCIDDMKSYARIKSVVLIN